MSMLTIIFTFFFFILALLAINILHILQTKGNMIKVLAMVVVFAIFLTQSSIFWTKDTTYRVDVIKPLETGWPVPFHYEPHPMNKVWEAPSTSGNNFFYSILINAGLWWAVFFVFAMLFRKIGVIVKPLSFMVIFLGLVSLIIVAIGINFINSKMDQLQNPGMNNPVVPVVTPALLPSPAN